MNTKTSTPLATYQLPNRATLLLATTFAGIIFINFFVAIQFIFILDLRLPGVAYLLLSLVGGVVGFAIGAVYFRLRQYAVQLRHNELRFRAVLEHMPVMLDAYDEAGTIRFWNRECERVTGYAAAEVVGQPEMVAMLYPGEGKRPLTQHDYRNHESIVRCQDGTEKCILWSNLSNQFPIPGWASWRIGVEITEQKQAEDALRTAERDYRALFENIPDGIYRSSIDGRQLRANPALVALNGYDSEAEMLADVRDIATEWYVDPKRRVQFQRRIEEDGYVLNFESEVYRYKTREQIWISESAHVVRDEYGKPLYYEGTVKEITQQKRAETMLQTTAQIRLIADHLPVGIAYLDSEQRYRFANVYHQTMWGIRPDDLIGQPLTAVFNDDIYQIMQPYVTHALTGEQANFDVEQVQKNGRFLLNITLVPHIAQTQTVGFFVMVVDMTQQRAQTGARHHLQKMESLAKLAGSMANDFNNLLLVILGHASMAQTLLGSNHAAAPHLEKAAEATERAAAITRQMLLYAGHSRLSLADVSLNQLLQDRQGQLEAIVPDNVVLVQSLAEPPPMAKLDEVQVVQVVRALIHNGVEAINGRSGQITLTTGTINITSSDTQYWQHTAEPLPASQYAFLEISDTGSGMDAETVNKIFDPFFTTKDAGDGMSLSAVLGVIRAHKGGLHVQSEPGQGTSLRLLFPLADVAAAAASVPTLPPPHHPPPLADGVLVIDDDDAVRTAIVGMIRPQKLPIYAAAGGQEGIDLFQQHQADIGLIILDIVMPGMDGEETYQHLRQIDPYVPIILSSGYDDKEAARRLVDNVYTGFLQKPYRAPTLVKLVWHYLQKETR